MYLTQIKIKTIQKNVSLDQINFARSKIGFTEDSSTAKSVPAGTKNFFSEGFLLAKHKDTMIPTMTEPFSPPSAWF